MISAGQLLDFSSPVTVNASSFNVSSMGVTFAPQLAIQPDTGAVWSACFISNKEPNPWFRLEFKAVTAISNVRMSMRRTPIVEMPSDFHYNHMNNLSVYVSNSSTLENSDKQPCGSPWRARKVSNIVIDCGEGEDLKGRFLYVTVPSTESTYLLICSIVVNRENGNLKALHVCCCML